MDHRQVLACAPKALPGEPASDLAQRALLDVEQVCKLGAFSRSYFLGLVAKKEAPQPLRFGSRCTRWRAAEVNEFLMQRERRAMEDVANEAFMKDRAKKASDAAVSKRRQTAPTRVVGADTCRAAEGQSATWTVVRP